MDAKKFGTFIATLRKENNMTQVELAQKLQGSQIMGTWFRFSRYNYDRAISRRFGR